MPKKPFKFPVAATCMMIIGVMILCALGTWQLYRLAWKQDILVHLDAAYAAADNSALPLDVLRAGEVSFAYGTLAGDLLVDRSFLLGPRVFNKEIGYSLMIPLRVDRGEVVVVNMGWTDQALADVQSQFHDVQTVSITGLARQPYWNSFTPVNQPDQDQWYRPDLQEIALAKGLDDVLGYIVYASDLSGVSVAGFPRNERWEPKNNHAQYAAFWFAMAIVLIGVYYVRFFVAGKSDGY